MAQHMHHERPDRNGPAREAFEKNRKVILMTQDICAYCGKPVDKSLKYPDPWSATVDHIVPISQGGHPSSLDNLQLMHACCNRQKSDKLLVRGRRIADDEPKAAAVDDLPLHFDWAHYKGDTASSG